MLIASNASHVDASSSEQGFGCLLWIFVVINLNKCFKVPCRVTELIDQIYC